MNTSSVQYHTNRSFLIEIFLLLTSKLKIFNLEKKKKKNLITSMLFSYIKLIEFKKT